MCSGALTRRGYSVGGEPGTPDGLGGSAECPAEVFGVCSELVAGGCDPVGLGAGGVRTLLAAFPGHYRFVEAGLGVVVAVPGCLLGSCAPDGGAVCSPYVHPLSVGVVLIPPDGTRGGVLRPVGTGIGRLRRPSGGGRTPVRPHRGHTDRLTWGFAAVGVATLSVRGGSGVARCGPVWHYAVRHGYKHREHRSRTRRVLHVGDGARRCFLLRGRRRPQRSLGFGRRVEHDRRGRR